MIWVISPLFIEGSIKSSGIFMNKRMVIKPRGAKNNNGFNGVLIAVLKKMARKTKIAIVTNDAKMRLSIFKTSRTLV